MRRSRRAFRGLGPALLVLAGLGLGGGCRTAPPPANVLLYLVDTLRVDGVGAYGSSRIETPAFDRMAREGVVFENAFANSTWTRASVASLFTGRFPRAHAARTRDDLLGAGLPTLAETLRSHGYDTGFVATNPNVSTVFGFGRGFDDVIELYARSRSGHVGSGELIARADDVTDAAIDWIDEAGRPFLLVVHTVDPHFPYAPPARFDDARSRDPRTVYPRDFVGRPLDPEARARARSLYDAEIRSNDAAFGDLLDALDERRIARDTLLVLTSDHGEEFWDVRPHRRGHGNALSDVQLRVPLLLRFPRSPRVSPGARHGELVAGVDLLPTVLDLLGLPAPEGLDGRSVFAGGAPTTFASIEIDDRRLYAIVDPPWKLVWDAVRGEEHLYRIPPGPAASEDAVAVAGHPALRAELRRRLRAHLAGSEDVPRAAPSPDALPAEVRDALEVLGYLGAEPEAAGPSRAPSRSDAAERRGPEAADRASKSAPR